MAKMSSFGLAVILCMASAWAEVTPASQKPLWSSKPDVAAFEKIENDHLAAADRFIATLVAAKGARTIENTLVPFDEAVREINTAAYFAGLMQQVHPDATFRDHATAMFTKVSGAQTAISLNQDVFKAMAALDVSKADAATKYYVERQLLEFKLAGVNKDDATRAKLKELNEKLTDEVSNYDRNISDDQKVV